jgi:hypothetical protein
MMESHGLPRILLMEGTNILAALAVMGVVNEAGL